MTLKLLVADDSVTIQKLVGLAFNDEDAVIESVSSGDAALDRLQEFSPDIVLADVFMPGGSGYEVCERIKHDPKQAHIPVVLLVGTFDPFDEAEASRVKSDGHLRKPFDTSELLQTVRSLVGEKMRLQKSEDFEEPLAEVAHAGALQAPALNPSSAGRLVDRRVWESFVGSNQVLELFDSGTLAAVRVLSRLQGYPAADQTSKANANAKTPVTISDQFSEDFLNLIVERVVRRMSPDAIREVAWEVVPELSEAIIRRSIEERNKS